VNVAFNGRLDQISVRRGDLYETVIGESFDTIVVNPPLPPIPANLPYPFVGAGGPDGLDLVWRILEGAPDHLTADGTLHSLGATPSDGFLPTRYDQLKHVTARLGLDVMLTITAHVPADANSRWSAGVGATNAAVSGADHRETIHRLANAYIDAGGSHICAYFLRAQLGRGQLKVRDLSDEGGASFWYV
jgi:release factor glutamine methyltransferase